MSHYLSMVVGMGVFPVMMDHPLHDHLLHHLLQSFVGETEMSIDQNHHLVLLSK